MLSNANNSIIATIEIILIIIIISIMLSAPKSDQNEPLPLHRPVAASTVHSFSLHSP